MSDDPLAELRRSVEPVMAALGAPHEHDAACAKSCWYAHVERAAMRAVAQARVDGIAQAIARLEGFTWEPYRAPDDILHKELADAEALLALLGEEKVREN